MTRRVTSRSDRRLRGPQPWPERHWVQWRDQPHRPDHLRTSYELANRWSYRVNQRAERKHRRKRKRHTGWRPGR